MTSLAILDTMQVFVTGPDAKFLRLLEERRAQGNDRWDEVWDGVLHVVPPPSSSHQRFEGRLERVLFPLAEREGFETMHNVAVLDHEKNFRAPDIVVVKPADIVKNGVSRAELAIEILSPSDESRQKFGFYAARGIPELWLVHPETRAIEVYLLRDGAYALQPAADDGTVIAPLLGLSLRVIDGPKLHLAWADGAAEI